MTQKQERLMKDYRYEYESCVRRVRELQLKQSNLRLEELECDRRGEIVTKEWWQEMSEVETALQAAYDARTDAKTQLDELYDEIERGAETSL